MKKPSVLLFILCLALEIHPQISVGKQWNSFRFERADSTNLQDLGAWSIGMCLEAPVSRAMPGAPPFLWMSGQGEYCAWNTGYRDGIDIQSSFATRIALLVELFDAIKIGPEIGVIGIFPGDWGIIDGPTFGTTYGIFSEIHFTGTPLGIGYNYSYAPFQSWHHMDFKSNSFCVIINIPAVFTKLR